MKEQNKNIIDEFLSKNRNSEIDKQVEQKAKEMEQNKVMSADEWILLKDNRDGEVWSQDTEELAKEFDLYANYILSQRIDELAERIAEEYEFSYMTQNGIETSKLNIDKLKKIANDFKTELNLNN